MDQTVYKVISHEAEVLRAERNALAERINSKQDEVDTMHNLMNSLNRRLSWLEQWTAEEDRLWELRQGPDAPKSAIGFDCTEVPL
jgi:uncharacterized protein YoxC